MRRSLMTIALLLSPALHASTISVAVSKYGVQGSQPSRMLLVAFADEPVTVDVTVAMDENGPALDATKWWQQLDWTLRDTVAKRERKLAPRSLDVVAATRNALMVGSRAQHRGVFRIGKLPAGNYLLRVEARGVTGSDVFAIRNGDETPFIKDKYLEVRAERSKSYKEFRAVQLERAALQPKRADIWIAMAARALEQGSEEDAAEAFARAISLMEKNAAQLSKENPKEAKEIRQKVAAAIAHIRALEAKLPYYFANRRRLQVVEEQVDGSMHYVLKDRRSGAIDHVIRPAE